MALPTKAPSIRQLPCPCVFEGSTGTIAATMARMGKPRACLSEIPMSTAKCDLCFGHGRGCTHKRIDEHEDARGNWPATPARL